MPKSGERWQRNKDRAVVAIEHVGPKFVEYTDLGALKGYKKEVDDFLKRFTYYGASG